MEYSKHVAEAKKHLPDPYKWVGYKQVQRIVDGVEVTFERTQDPETNTLTWEPIFARRVAPPDSELFSRTTDTRPAPPKKRRRRKKSGGSNA